MSRALIERTTEQLAEFLGRRLDEIELAAMFVDGIDVAGHAVIIALGVTADGTKAPLGVNSGRDITKAAARNPGFSLGMGDDGIYPGAKRPCKVAFGS